MKMGLDATLGIWWMVFGSAMKTVAKKRKSAWWSPHVVMGLLLSPILRFSSFLADLPSTTLQFFGASTKFKNLVARVAHMPGTHQSRRAQILQ